MGHKSVVPFLGELSSNGNNWIALGGGKKYGQAGATIISPAGRWSLLTVNPVAAAEAKVEFYANGVKRFELVLPNAAGPFIDRTGFYDAEEGDEIAIVFVRNNAFNRQVRYTASMQFEAEGGTGPVAFHHSSRANTVASTGSSVLVFGHEYNSSQTTQLSRTPSSFQSSGVLSHLRVVCDNNPSSNAVTATVHVNGVPSNLNVSFGAGFVGTVDNVTDTVSVSPDDLVTIVCDQLPNGGFYRLDQVSVRFTSTDGAYDLFNYPTTANISLLPNGNVFATVGAGTFATNTSSGLILPHAVEVSKGRIVTGASDKVARMGFYSQGWFDPFDTEPSASISEHISAGLGTRVSESAWIAFGKSTLVSAGSSERLIGAVGMTLRESPLQTSYDNPGGSGERRQGIYYAWWDASFNHAGGRCQDVLSGDSSSSFYPGSTAGECAIVFDFMAPRVIDEMRFVLSGAHNIGSWAFEASHDIVTWDVLTPAFTQSVSVPTWPAHGNATAYRYYRLHRPSGTTSINPYWRRAEFRIDDNAPSDGWFSPLSIGDRSSQVVVTGGYWSSVANAKAIVQREVCTQTTSAYFSSGSGGECRFTFSDPVALTGFMWWWGSYTNQGFHTLEASSDGSTWTTLIESFNFYPGVRASSPGSQMPWFGVEWENETEYSIYRLRVVSGSRSSAPFSGLVNFKVAGGIGPVEVVIYPSSGSLILTGSVPEVLAAIEVDPINGGLVLTGEYPTVHTETIVEPSAGSLVVSGSIPTIRVGSYVTPSSGDLELSGLYPIVYTLKAVISSQIPIMMLAEPEAPPARSSQISVSALAEPVAPPVKSSQTPVSVLGEPIPPVRSSQNMVAILAHGSPCTTQRCQIWTIHRRDGKIFRFTSHDEEVKRGPAVYLPCKSLNPTAAENASTLGSVGNIELTGIIDHDSITEADLYGGLFDDAFVTVDLYSWGDRRVSPRRLAAGWTGSIGTGDTGFTLEILGPGSRLEQQALVQMITPSCRWIFGSPQCGVNIEAMKVPSVVVKAHSRGSMRLDLPAEPTGRQWSNGRIRFITGANAGITVETKTVDFTSGEVVLWQSPGFLPEPGDEVEILPGCDFNRDGGCKVYNNVINFGGFPDVPGSDALLETPDAKY